MSLDVNTATTTFSRPSSGVGGKRILVGLWMGCEFGRDVLTGIREEISARSLAWRIRFVNRGSSFAGAVRWMIQEGRIDGAISCFEDDRAVVSALRRARIPAVWLSRERPVTVPEGSDGRTAHVALDTAAVVRAAVQHFREWAGFRSFGFVDSHWDEGWSRLRGDLCLRELSRLGLRGHRFSAARRRRGRGLAPDFGALATWIRSLPKPAAILVANDATATDVVEVCEVAGVSVPRDAAILGMDDDSAYCRSVIPNLSSVQFDGRRAGSLCVEALAALFAGSSPPAHPLLYGVSAIERRASTGAVSTAGKLVQSALDYIDENACRGISLSDVVRHLGVSRPLVTLRFRELLGKSVGDAIRERQLVEAARLLRDTDRFVDDVAIACGFGGSGAFRRCVRNVEGLSPAAWRTRLRLAKAAGPSCPNLPVGP